MKQRLRSRTSTGSVVVVGVGNIGSHLVPLLARLPQVRRVTLVDRDVYEARNLTAQAMPRAAVGRPKAKVQAAVLRQLNPKLEVLAIATDLRAVPLGRLRADVVVTCLDSLAARLVANEIVWRLGVPWLDGGVLPSDLLARVTAYQPGRTAPCLACGLADTDFARLVGTTPCQPASETIPTNGSAALGALTAAVLALEIERVLDQGATPLAGREWVMDARHHRQMVTSLRFNAACRFDHATLKLEPRQIPEEFSAEQAAAFAAKAAGLRGELTLAVAGHRWAKALHCPKCGLAKQGLHILGRRHGGAARCVHCDVAMQATAFSILERLDRQLPRAQRQLPLKSLGVELGDILTFRSARQEAHFEATINGET